MCAPKSLKDSVEEWRISGKAIVPGIALGKAFFLETSPLHIRELTLPQEEVEHEIHRYYKALNRSKSDIAALEQEIVGKQELCEVSSILQAHLEIIKDPLLTEEVVNTIRKDRKNAEYVFSSVMGKIEESLSAAQNSSVVVDRVQDIHDISNRVIGHLCCQHKSSLGESDQNIIVFAKELTPSEVASANPAYIRGFVSLIGAVTSHTAIVSRAKNIPYLANLPEELWEQAKEYSGKLVLVDGIRGELIFNPKPKTLQNRYEQKSYTVAAKPLLSSVSTVPIPTSVASHAGSLQDLSILAEYSPEISIGLFRSEFLALALRRIPSVQEQVAVYKQLASFSKRSKPSVLRLFDFCQDKPCPGDQRSCERSVRYLLTSPKILTDQLGAILEASENNVMKILLPGVSDVVEILKIKEFCFKIAQEQGTTSHMKNLLWGSMIELPSAVWLIEEILDECDFVTIGTNDLTQYTLGVSRDASLPSYLDVDLSPAVIRMIRHVTFFAKQKNIPVSICGEAAGQLQLAPLFVGLGVQELSVAIPIISELRQCLAGLDMNLCLEFADRLFRAKTCEEVKLLLA
ncbi:phosphoenolpyruvate--protein phosphotransferase [Chlamydia sp. 17-3921]|uniref:phosphoenolpyruvate--protein phosphotransferase n=1 Tax=Chlamydia sp. 17-3921 TaxID=2675798 RepID=UPI00191A659E|nr:phosphoenolpyruvate--protein phosphotransferase [Chlamydia sp. 17-3921]